MSELRKRGLITAVICSTPFQKLGQAQAKTFGCEDLPLIMIPHPLGGLKLDMVQKRAEVAIPQLLEIIKERLK